MKDESIRRGRVARVDCLYYKNCLHVDQIASLVGIKESTVERILERRARYAKYLPYGQYVNDFADAVEAQIAKAEAAGDERAFERSVLQARVEVMKAARNDEIARNSYNHRERHNKIRRGFSDARRAAS